MFGSLIGKRKENLAVILLAGQGPGMADGNVAMAEGMGLCNGWREQGKQEGSSFHLQTLAAWQVFGNVTVLPHGACDFYQQFAQACGLRNR